MKGRLLTLYVAFSCDENDRVDDGGGSSSSNIAFSFDGYDMLGDVDFR